MGMLAEEALSHGVNVTGVIPKSLFEKDVAHEQIDDLRVVGSMHERKRVMSELADGFVALPGGLRTFEELFEMLTWAQLGIHRKPCGILNICGYFDPVLSLLEHSVAEGFLGQVDATLLLVEECPFELLKRFDSYRPPFIKKWLTPDQG